MHPIIGTTLLPSPGRERSLFPLPLPLHSRPCRGRISIGRKKSHLTIVKRGASLAARETKSGGGKWEGGREGDERFLPVPAIHSLPVLVSCFRAPTPPRAPSQLRPLPHPAATLSRNVFINGIAPPPPPRFFCFPSSILGSQAWRGSSRGPRAEPASVQFCVYVRIVSEASGRWQSFEYEIYIYIYMKFLLSNYILY